MRDNKPVCQIKDNRIVGTFDSMKEASEAVNGQSSHISECCHFIRITHKGYTWRCRGRETK